MSALDQRIQAAHDLAAEGVDMVRRRDVVMRSLQDVADRFTDEIAHADDVHAELARGVEDALARAMTPGPPGKDSTVPGPPGKDSTVPGPPGKDSTVPGPPGKDSTVPGPPGRDSTVPGPPGKDSTVPGPPGKEADTKRLADLEAAVLALQKLGVTVAFGTANLPASIAAGDRANVEVKLSRSMGSASYSTGCQSSPPAKHPPPRPPSPHAPPAPGRPAVGLLVVPWRTT